MRKSRGVALVVVLGVLALLTLLATPAHARGSDKSSEVRHTLWLNQNT